METNELPRPGTTSRDDSTGSVIRRVIEPHAALERALIDEFLAGRGHSSSSIGALNAPQRQSLLRAAAAFATLRLAEIEAKAHFVDEID